MFDDDLRFVPEALPDGRKAAEYLLFFAALPPTEVAQSATLAAQELRAASLIGKAAMPLQRLHVTVQPVCTFKQAWPGHRLSQVLEIAAELTPAFAPFPLRFDRVGSMSRQAPSALALKGDAASQRMLLDVTAPLAKALHAYGLDEFERGGGLPHMTLVHGAPLMHDRPVQPLAWTVDRLVLLLSHRGCSHYQRVGLWPLRGAVPAELF